jgi:hypothetical protein
MKLCEKSPAKDKNFPLEPIVATRQISRPPVKRAVFPIGDLLLPPFSRVIEDNLSRRP